MKTPLVSEVPMNHWLTAPGPETNPLFDLFCI